MAEREGFEPPVRFPVLQFSRLAPSTPRPPLQLLQFYYSGQFLPGFRWTFPLVFNLLHPAKVAVHGFSRPEPSTTRPPLRLLQFYYNPNFTAGSARDQDRML